MKYKTLSCTIQDRDVREFKKICRLLGHEPVNRGSVESDRGYKDIKFSFSAKMPSPWQGIQGYINSHKHPVQAARILYALYACNILVLKGHKYSTYAQWKDEHPGMTLDHRMPKSKYPTQTFVASNWQPLSRSENSSKSNNVYVRDSVAYMENLCSDAVDLANNLLF